MNLNTYSKLKQKITFFTQNKFVCQVNKSYLTFIIVKRRIRNFLKSFIFDFIFNYRIIKTETEIELNPLILTRVLTI